MIRKTFNIERKTIDAEQGIYEAMISTESIDRDGDVIRAAGVDTSNYMRNPVVLFGHTYNDIDAVVGKTLSIETIPGEGIRARFQFATADVSQKADTVRKLWAGEFLNATSIGFIPDMASAKPNATKTGIEFGKSELLEFSIVPIPSNQDALRLAVKSFDEGTDTLTKRGRVLSANNEKTLREAQADLDAAKAKLDGVLSQLGDAPEEDTREASPQDVTLEAISETTETSALNVRELAPLFGDFQKNLKEVLYG